jgi:hypothetical protein
MKAIISLLAVLTVSTLAHADGFVCTSQSGLVVRIYDHTHANEGTRTAAVMTVSDSAVGAGRKTIAKFTAVNETLSSLNTVYTGKVDLRFNDSGRQGENIGGTKLGQLSEIAMSVHFSYNQPVANGEEVSAQLVLSKRNGDSIVESATCARYLKN